jgi:repressor LexA
MTATRQKLTKRQEKIYRFIRRNIQRLHRSPTYREIGREFGITSPNGIACHIEALSKKGWVEVDDRDWFGIRLTGVKVTIEDLQ